MRRWSSYCFHPRTLRADAHGRDLRCRRSMLAADTAGVRLSGRVRQRRSRQLLQRQLQQRALKSACSVKVERLITLVRSFVGLFGDRSVAAVHNRGAGWLRPDLHSCVVARPVWCQSNGLVEPCCVLGCSGRVRAGCSPGARHARQLHGRCWRPVVQHRLQPGGYPILHRFAAGRVLTLILSRCVQGYSVVGLPRYCNAGTLTGTNQSCTRTRSLDPALAFADRRRAWHVVRSQRIRARFPPLAAALSALATTCRAAARARSPATTYERKPLPAAWVLAD